MEDNSKFGILVCKLREGLGWSRKKLAQKSGLSESIIEKIESGAKIKIEIDYLAKLASGLELTSMDRKEFFLAAITQMDPAKLVRPRNNRVAKESPDPLKTREFLIQSVAELRIPAFVSDVYCDILAANKLVLKFLGISQEMISAVKTLPAGLNSMRVVFSDISGFKGIMNDVWQQSMWMNMRQFRRDSFRYVEEKYYMRLKEALDDIPLFDDYWDLVNQSLNDHNIDLDHVQFFHPGFQIDIHYVVTQTTALTEYGELYLVSYLPANLDTEKLFSQLAKEVDEDVSIIMNGLEKLPKDINQYRVIRLAPWPNKE